VGGGAFLFRTAVKGAFPRHRIREVKELMFAKGHGSGWRGRTTLAA
jgi:plasmid segregation protein ParM